MIMGGASSWLLRGGTLVPVDSHAPLGRGDLLILDGVIAALGVIPADDLRLVGVPVLDVTGCVVLPGLVQAHIHLCQTLGRGLADDLPLPVFAVNKDQVITFANQAGLRYLGLKSADVLQKNLYSVFDLSFSEENTLDAWLQDCRANKAKDSHAWQHVRLKLADQTTLKQFDMAAAYSKDDPSGIEMLLTIFDQTDRYNGDDQGLDFIALAVHELRTPLTALRGYIEIFEDELAGKLDPEMNSFMDRMEASAQQLTAFVGNILNVARIQEGQLALKLAEEDWASVVKSAAENLSLAARIKGVTIKYAVDANVPKVGVDKISVIEVLNNLLDNAIKYSGNGQGKVVTIHARLTTDNMVETTVTDQGVGIPASVIPSLFEKFHRNHHNQARIGGTGLGLYLCLSLVKAQGGNIWIKSREGQGTSVSFTVQPYASLAGNLKDSNNKGITRNAHGWIKNHSLYRR
jgi:signal transduction histidine kinase